ncbi:hypothetical protein HMPREF9372_1312 [Sporosarcina newyorkensis 2681]|uniref:Uncharacterized protein n=1 Tax=Sporosarcina newyorkensis 2681 TaxID=1027292 RepID=F9DR82_9BACL|nr:hypothetical protein HMPREF9372_1312 [Sporosarcina newyorkensis 2681]
MGKYTIEEQYEKREKWKDTTSIFASIKKVRMKGRGPLISKKIFSKGTEYNLRQIIRRSTVWRPLPKQSWRNTYHSNDRKEVDMNASKPPNSSQAKSPVIHNRTAYLQKEIPGRHPAPRKPGRPTHPHHRQLERTPELPRNNPIKPLFPIPRSKIKPQKDLYPHTIQV